METITNKKRIVFRVKKFVRLLNRDVFVSDFENELDAQSFIAMQVDSELYRVVRVVI